MDQVLHQKEKPVTTFKQSSTWWGDISLEEMIQKADFVFTKEGRHSYRPRIVTKEFINGHNCFEIDSDRWGITLKGMSTYGKWDYETTTHNSPYVRKFIENFIREHCDLKFINPSWYTRHQKQRPWKWKIERRVLWLMNPFAKFIFKLFYSNRIKKS